MDDDSFSGAGDGGIDQFPRENARDFVWEDNENLVELRALAFVYCQCVSRFVVWEPGWGEAANVVLRVDKTSSYCSVSLFVSDQQACITIE